MTFFFWDFSRFKGDYFLKKTMRLLEFSYWDFDHPRKNNDVINDWDFYWRVAVIFFVLNAGLSLWVSWVCSCFAFKVLERKALELRAFTHSGMMDQLHRDHFITCCLVRVTVFLMMLFNVLNFGAHWSDSSGNMLWIVEMLFIMSLRPTNGTHSDCCVCWIYIKTASFSQLIFDNTTGCLYPFVAFWNQTLSSFFLFEFFSSFAFLLSRFFGLQRLFLKVSRVFLYSAGLIAIGWIPEKLAIYVVGIN